MKRAKVDKEATPAKPSVRWLARVLKRSPSHICRVMRGERTSASLSRRLMALGVEVA